FGLDALQEFKRLLWLLGLVALVILPEHFVASGLHHNSLYRRRTHIETNHELGLVVARLVLMLDLLNAGSSGLQGCDLDQSWTFVIVHHASLNKLQLMQIATRMIFPGASFAFAALGSSRPQWPARLAAPVPASVSRNACPCRFGR